MVYRGGCGSRLDDEYASPSVTMSDRGRFELEHRGRSDEMAHFVGLDVSVKETSVCVVDDAGKVILEQKVLTEPARSEERRVGKEWRWVWGGGDEGTRG